MFQWYQAEGCQICGPGDNTEHTTQKSSMMCKFFASMWKKCFGHKTHQQPRRKGTCDLFQIAVQKKRNHSFIVSTFLQRGAAHEVNISGSAKRKALAGEYDSALSEVRSLSRNNQAAALLPGCTRVL